MKTDPIAAMYQSLTSLERANLATHYLAGCNENELARLIDSAPVVTQRCADPEFRRLFNQKSDAASLLAVEYWRCRALASEAALAFAVHAERVGSKKAAELAQASLIWKARVSALQHVMKYLNDKCLLNVDLVRQMAMVTQDDLLPSLTAPDGVYQTETMATLLAILDANGSSGGS